ncbi:uncharacterized protein LOC128225155 [Mya arenaria]|nr:uncharacterized protein LOC128225155 [Mya arenaria]
MRAKYMFRSGDLETCTWGYDWSSSDNESVKAASPVQIETKPVIKTEPESPTLSDSRPPLKRTYSDISEASDEEEEPIKFTLPRSENLTHAFDWTSYGLINKTANETCLSQFDKHGMGTQLPYDSELRFTDHNAIFDCENYDHEETITDTNGNEFKTDMINKPEQQNETIKETENEKGKIGKENVQSEQQTIKTKSDTNSNDVIEVPHDDVYAMEVTCDDVTVIFQESSRPKGFFLWRN